MARCVLSGGAPQVTQHWTKRARTKVSKAGSSQSGTVLWAPCLSRAPSSGRAKDAPLSHRQAEQETRRLTCVRARQVLRLRKGLQSSRSVGTAHKAQPARRVVSAVPFEPGGTWRSCTNEQLDLKQKHRLPTWQGVFSVGGLLKSPNTGRSVPAPKFRRLDPVKWIKRTRCLLMQDCGPH